MVAIIEGDRGSKRAYAVRADDGRRYPLKVAKGQRLAANATFTGDITISGSTHEIAYATTTEQATAAATLAAHKTYIALPQGVGAFADDATIGTWVDTSAKLWPDTIPNVVSSFPHYSTIAKYTSTVITLANCTTAIGNMWNVWTEAEKQFPGVDFFASPNHLVVLLPETCSNGTQTGVGTVGQPGSGGETLQFAKLSYGDTVAHELGHNLGLGHANLMDPVYGERPYCDVYSIMGYEVGVDNLTALSSNHRDEMGFLTVGEVQTFPATTLGSTTVTLAGRGETSGLRGLKIVEPGTNKVFYVDYRSGGGLDAGDLYTVGDQTCGYSFHPGIEMTTAGADPTETALIPGPSKQAYAAVGQALKTPTDQVSVTVNSMSATSANLTVTYAHRLQFTTAPKPIIVGTVAKGQTVTVNPGTWSPTPDSQTYQWYYGGSPATDAYGNPGTGLSFAIPNSYVGYDLTVSVTSVKTGYVTKTMTSDPILIDGPPVMNPPPVPTIIGLAKPGETLTVDIGTYPVGTSTITDWFVGSGTSWNYVGYGDSLLLDPSMVGKSVRVRVTAFLSGFISTKADSLPYGPVQGDLKQLTVGSPYFTGRMRVYHYLKAYPGTWTPYTTFKYRWFADGVAITNATKRRLYLRRAQRGTMITVVVTGSKTGYQTASATSPARGPVRR